MNDQTKKAVAELRQYMPVPNPYIESLITAFTAELESAQRERVEAVKAVQVYADGFNKVREERDQAQAACAAKDAVLRQWKAYNQAPIPTTADEQEASGEQFTDVWFETDRALALDCGTGWKSPAEYAALEAKLAEAENTVDEQWMDAIAAQWNFIFGKPFDVRDGECRGEGVQANVNVIFERLEDAIKKLAEAEAERERFRVALNKIGYLEGGLPDASFCGRTAREALATVPEEPSK